MERATPAAAAPAEPPMLSRHHLGAFKSVISVADGCVCVSWQRMVGTRGLGALAYQTLFALLHLGEWSARTRKRSVTTSRWGKAYVKIQPKQTRLGHDCFYPNEMNWHQGGSQLSLTRMATKPSSDPLAPREGGGRRASVQQTESILQHTRLRDTRYCQRAKTPPVCRYTGGERVQHAGGIRTLPREVQSIVKLHQRIGGLGFIPQSSVERPTGGVSDIKQSRCCTIERFYVGCSLKITPPELQEDVYTVKILWVPNETSLAPPLVLEKFPSSLGRPQSQESPVYNSLIIISALLPGRSLTSLEPATF
ncbi:hypothetical protein DNTS_024701 [Danionella cerebrum]|uniref:Uncharacterized protein n=1 Tax=Danionella cerebrum TaxID=2873325 RepID=A0A553QR29_9TELE|nr:hypothetical protein DNTS_024701 [Danionella translucida]